MGSNSQVLLAAGTHICGKAQLSPPCARSPLGASKRVGVHSMCSMQVPDSSALISVTDRMNASSSRTCPATSGISGVYQLMSRPGPLEVHGSITCRWHTMLTVYSADHKDRSVEVQIICGVRAPVSRTWHRTRRIGRAPTAESASARRQPAWNRVLTSPARSCEGQHLQEAAGAALDSLIIFKNTGAQGQAHRKNLWQNKIKITLG